MTCTACWPSRSTTSATSSRRPTPSRRTRSRSSRPSALDYASAADGRLRPFGEGSGAPTPIAVENFQMLQGRQTADSLAGPDGKESRVNLLNWDGKGSPAASSRLAATRRRRRHEPRLAPGLPTRPGPSWPGRRPRCCSTTRTRRCSASVPMVRRAAHGAAPSESAAPIERFLVHLETTPCRELQADYVETFDNRRRCNLFLTYFAHGDTRKRGMALLRFKQTYLASGFELSDDGAARPPLRRARVRRHDRPAAGRDLMLDHRAGLELLRLRCATCTRRGPPWWMPSARRCRRCGATSATPYAAWRPRAAGGGGRARAVRDPGVQPRPRRPTAHARRASADADLPGARA